MCIYNILYVCHIFDDEQIPYQKHSHILLGNIMQYFQWEPCLKVEVQALQGVAGSFEVLQIGCLTMCIRMFIAVWGETFRGSWVLLA